MAKLYLIRRNLETFTGPMTLVEMKEAYKRMQFGLSDEVSGHCGPWVQFDKVDRVKKYYPEILRVVNEDMLAGWGVSNHGERVVNEDTKRLEVKPSRGVGLALTFLVIALLAFAAAVYMANGSKLSGKIKNDGAAMRPEDIQAFLDRGDAAGFDAYMQTHDDDLVDRLVKPVKPEVQWLPYMRLYAFSHDGIFPGLDPKWLRGNVVAAAPIDCSLKAWQRRWRTGLKTWNDMVTQRKLVHAHWARLLAWDPYWIRRRDNKGWIGNQNYYVGCLTMADKAIESIGADPSLVANAADWDKIGLTQIRHRISWLLDVARTGQSALPSTPAVDDSLSLWSCFEAAKDAPALAKCRDGMPTDQDLWLAYDEERYGWNLLRLALAVKGPVPPDLVQLLATQATRMSKEDHFTRFDYRAEARLLKTLLKQGTPVEKAVEKTQTEFPDVKLSH